MSLEEETFNSGSLFISCQNDHMFYAASNLQLAQSEQCPALPCKKKIFRFPILNICLVLHASWKRTFPEKNVSVKIVF